MGYNNYHDIFAINHHGSYLALLCIIIVCLCPFVLVGLAAYYANFIQLGLDQFMEESSTHLSLFIHWAIWMNVLGTAIVALPVDIALCSLNIYEQVAILSPLILTLFGFPFVLAFSCWKRRWFIANPAQHNPYKMVIKILKFARTYKWPLRRSAFTYCDDERPSRVGKGMEDHSQQNRWKMSKHS
jgi:hypothetical protein